MSKVLVLVRRYRWFFLVLLVIAGSVFYYQSASNNEGGVTQAVVETVAAGTVSSGIKTTGTIVAAQKLNLDVYKQSRRIDAVYVANAGRVEKGDRIFSFDKSSAYVAVQSAQVEVAQNALALAVAEARYADPNTTVRTLRNTLVSLHQDKVQAEKDLVQAKRTYFNANTVAEPITNDAKLRARPTLSGLYDGSAEGIYRVRIYASGAKSGFSYEVSGLESITESMIAGIPTPLGSKGLKILFPENIKSGDVWEIHVPNKNAPEYVVNRETYDRNTSTLLQTIENKKVEIANTELQIKRELENDSSTARDLELAKARASVAASRQKLSENVDVTAELDVVAPFSGTVEGMKNVVVGATPSGATNDSISLGTLISDDFLVNFSLNAVDIGKVTVGKKVLVTLTSVPGSEPLTAEVTEVSSLPESDKSAKYQVRALITLPASSTVSLREGLLADVEVVDKEVTDVIRIPLTALTYQDGRPQVARLGAVSPEQQVEIDTYGVVSATNGTVPSYLVDVELGLVGSFYVEVHSGLVAGDRIVVTKTEPETQSVINDGSGTIPISEESVNME